MPATFTEESWLTGPWPDPLITYLRKARASERKFRLLTAACCRTVWDRLPTDEARAAVDAAESWADGVINQKKLRSARAPAESLAKSFSEMAKLAEEAGQRGQWAKYCRMYEGAMAAVEAATPRVDKVRQALWYVSRVEPDTPAATLGLQTSLIRDIFGNPFRPVAFDPCWRTEAVVGLARGMYESRDFAPMPVLADALEDAGCADPDVLAHCREPGPHVRGCWVVDLVLGKA